MFTVHITECVLHKYTIIKAEPVYQISTKIHILIQNKIYFVFKSISTTVLELRHDNNLVIPQYQVDNTVLYMKC